MHLIKDTTSHITYCVFASASLSSPTNYDKLVGKDLEKMIAGSRVDVAEDKQEPTNFVLWKPADAEDDEPSIFQSPFGPGRPG